MIYKIMAMRRLRSNNLKYFFISGLFCLLCFLTTSCLDKCFYANKLNEILDVGNFRIKNQERVNDTWSFAIGEWYFCEVYNIDKKSMPDFFIEDKHNKLYLNDTSWLRKDWDRVPIDNRCNEVKTLVFNYRSSTKIDRLIKELDLLYESPNAYYSFLCKPSFENPSSVIFFLLDEVELKLYVIDINF